MPPTLLDHSVTARRPTGDVIAEQSALNLLFQPLTVRGLTLKNRIVFPPCVTNFAAEDGSVTERSRAHYRARARGGAALVTVEASYVTRAGKTFACALGIDDDRLVPGLRRLAEAIHSGGALAAIQLWHAGRRASSSTTGLESVSASEVPGADGIVPHALTVAEMARLLDEYGRATKRARQAGFDMVEIHMAHGYLLNQFLSPLSNKREDQYGGSLDNRLRFPLEVTAEVRRAAGTECPIIARISGDEYMPGGLTLADSQQIARRLQAAGIDLISVSGGSPESAAWGPTGRKKIPAKTPPGYFTHLAAGIKAAVDIPVTAVGRLGEPSAAAEVLASGRGDLVALGRSLLADPEWPNKVAAGLSADIRRCTCCNGCLHHLVHQHAIVCKQNKTLGQEYLSSS